jgi:Lon protease-like protein
LIFHLNLTSDVAADNQTLPLFAYEVRRDDFF